tara:strand:- start:724 stop:852 length:129 start_codon:yes stop_codon:yes gene_type:complete
MLGFLYRKLAAKFSKTSASLFLECSDDEIDRLIFLINYMEKP